MTAYALNMLLAMQCERDGDFSKLHKNMKHSILFSNVRDGEGNENKKLIDLKQAEEAIERRSVLITELSKNEDFREVFEEVYVLIIAKTEESDELE